MIDYSLDVQMEDPTQATRLDFNDVAFARFSCFFNSLISFFLLLNCFAVQIASCSTTGRIGTMSAPNCDQHATSTNAETRCMRDVSTCLQAHDFDFFSFLGWAAGINGTVSSNRRPKISTRSNRA